MSLVRDADERDLLYVDSLRKKEGNALGFIPIGAYQSTVLKAPIDGRKRWVYSKLFIVQDNEDPTGFCYATFAQDYAKIVQIVVQEDARRWHRAMLLEKQVDEHARSLSKKGITCRVAIDLESNLFWRGIGYTPIRVTSSTWLNQRESNSKRPLVIYEKQLNESLFELNPLLKVRYEEAQAF